MRGVVKIGGAAGNCAVSLMEEVAERVSLGEEWVVVHGASARMNQLCENAGITPRHVMSPGGYRSRFVGVAEQALFEAAASRNSVELLELLNEQGGRGCPVFPSSQRSVQACRKDSLRILEEGRLRVLRGNYSGRISRVYTEPMEEVLGCGGIPLLPPLGYDQESGLSLNVDGDRLAAAVAEALGASVLVIASNVPGLLEDPSREESLICRGSLENWEAPGGLCPGEHEAQDPGLSRGSGRGSSPDYSLRQPEGTFFGIRFAGRRDPSMEPAFYGTRGIEAVRGEGEYLWDGEGRRYLDFLAGHGAALFGHAHPRLIQALEGASRNFWTIGGSLQAPSRRIFMEKLEEHFPGYTSFLCNSGAEAMEGALKLLLALRPERPRILALRRSFHGRTLGATFPYLQSPVPPPLAEGSSSGGASGAPGASGGPG